MSNKFRFGYGHLENHALGGIHGPLVHCTFYQKNIPLTPANEQIP